MLFSTLVQEAKCNIIMHVYLVQKAKIGLSISKIKWNAITFRTELSLS